MTAANVSLWRGRQNTAHNDQATRAQKNKGGIVFTSRNQRKNNASPKNHRGCPSLEGKIAKLVRADQQKYRGGMPVTRENQHKRSNLWGQRKHRCTLFERKRQHNINGFYILRRHAKSEEKAFRSCKNMKPVYRTLPEANRL